MDWDVILTLLITLRSPTYTAAANKLGISKATLRQRLRSLEESCGETLFESVGGRLHPSPTAVKLGGVSQRIEAELARVLPSRSVRALRVEGSVRVTAGELWALETLPPLFSQLRLQHPGLVLRLGVRQKVEDLLRGEADIAVRRHQPVHKALITHRVGATRVGLFAHRSLFETARAPRRLEDLANFDLIGSEQDWPALRMLRDAGFLLPPGAFRFRIDSPIGQLTAMRAGLGVGITLSAIAAEDPVLVPVLPDVTASFDLGVAMHKDLRDTSRMRVVFDAMSDFLSRRLEAAEAAWSSAVKAQEAP